MELRKVRRHWWGEVLVLTGLRFSNTLADLLAYVPNVTTLRIVGEQRVYPQAIDM